MNAVARLAELNDLLDKATRTVQLTADSAEELTAALEAEVEKLRATHAALNGPTEARKRGSHG
jgi:ABC-type transporter Mla subunit MlaD